MASAGSKVVMSSEDDPLHFLAIVLQAKTLFMQMQFRSTAAVLQKRVLEPIISEIDAKSFKGLARFMNSVWRNPEIRALMNIFCEAFAQLAEVHIVSVVDSILDPNSAIFLNTIVRNPLIQDLLINSYNVDVTARLKFTGACAQVVFERFHRTDEFDETYTYTPELASLMNSSRDMEKLVCAMAKQTERQTDQISEKIRIDAALIKTFVAFTMLQSSYLIDDGEDKLPERLSIVQVLEVWQYWQKLGFPELYLEWIVCLALHTAREHYYTHDAKEKKMLETFYLDLADVIVRSLECGVFVLSA